MKEIHLIRGKVTLVDDADFENLIGFRWGAVHIRGIWYAQRTDGILMHTFLMKTKQGKEIDHKDHDGLNNQRYNLRECSHQQNSWNKAKMSGTSSKYKGVYRCKKADRWIGKIVLNNKNCYLGCFKTETGAARAYNTKARELFGEYACLNVILNKKAKF